MVTQCSFQRSLLHSRFQWGEALRDDTKNGCVADYLQRALTSDGGRLLTRDSGNFVFNRVAVLNRTQLTSLAMSQEL